MTTTEKRKRGRPKGTGKPAKNVRKQRTVWMTDKEWQQFKEVGADEVRRMVAEAAGA